MRETILTGVRANEEPTLGNFLGAYVPMVELAKKYAGEKDVNMFVPDLHSFTTPIEHEELYGQIIRGVKYYMAAGLPVDSEGVSVYRQSFVSAHSEMAWILSCFTGFGEMQRMTQFKDKSEDLRDSVSVGLFSYPVLMAGDILLYSAKYVPVGEDQFQHLEITRDIAMRMNRKFGEIFTVPVKTAEQVKFMNLDEGLRVRSLTEPEKKMSKSAENENSKILLSDKPEVAAKKIMSATTDSVGKIKFDMFNQPGVSNLLQIVSLLKGVPLQDVISRWVGETRYGDLKNETAEVVRRFLVEFQEKVAAISDDDVLKVLEQGEERARVKAGAKLLEVQKVLGLRR
ncbi:tryptophan--tRNA ligase [Candidatus Saccharibacteria bacterium]|nr:tryptophan--tRNA ligase [Candidatus Saccharibacteria bacterium]